LPYTAYFSVVLDCPPEEVWEVVRDFNSYPTWVNGVSESHIEDGPPGTAVGAVRNFANAGRLTRQRLIAHSDRKRFFTYAGCSPLMSKDGETIRTIGNYEGTLQLRTISEGPGAAPGEGQRCFVAWSSQYECSEADAPYWADWWASSLPAWLTSLREHMTRPG
jgi:hypothetical protein